MEKEKEKKNIIVLEEKTSHFIFLMPALLSIVSLFYLFNSGNMTNFLFTVMIVFLILLKSLLMFRGKKIVITKNKIYIYVNNKKFISWSLSEDFYIVNYSQNFLGKFLNYGTLTIINKDKQMYEYFYLNNVETSYSTIIQSYEKLMQKLDPSFIVSYKDNKSIKIDKVE